MNDLLLLSGPFCPYQQQQAFVGPHTIASNKLAVCLTRAKAAPRGATNHLAHDKVNLFPHLERYLGGRASGSPHNDGGHY